MNADALEPTIELLPLPTLPGEPPRFIIVLSQWPVRSGDAAAWESFREQAGAAAMVVAEHPVFIPDGIRSGLTYEHMRWQVHASEARSARFREAVQDDPNHPPEETEHSP